MLSKFLLKKSLLPLLTLVGGGVLGYFTHDYLNLRQELAMHKETKEPLRRSIRPDEKIQIGKEQKQAQFIRPSKLDHTDDQFERIQKRMKRMMESSFFSGGIFSNSMAKHFGRSNFEIHQAEDRSFKYIKINAPKVKKDNIDIQINNGMITIKGEIASENSRSQFSQSFNVPYGVMADKVSIETEGEEIVIKFPKKSV